MYLYGFQLCFISRVPGFLMTKCSSFCLKLLQPVHHSLLIWGFKIVDPGARTAIMLKMLTLTFQNQHVKFGCNSSCILFPAFIYKHTVW